MKYKVRYNENENYFEIIDDKELWMVDAVFTQVEEFSITSDRNTVVKEELQKLMKLIVALWKLI